MLILPAMSVRGAKYRGTRPQEVKVKIALIHNQERSGLCDMLT